MEDNQQPPAELKHEASDATGLAADGADAPAAGEATEQNGEGTRCNTALRLVGKHIFHGLILTSINRHWLQ